MTPYSARTGPIGIDRIVTPVCCKNDVYNSCVAALMAVTHSARRDRPDVTQPEYTRGGWSEKRKSTGKEVGVLHTLGVDGRNADCGLRDAECVMRDA